MSVFKIAKNTIYYGVVPKLTILINIAILPLITPFLSTYDYGIVGVITSYSGILSSIAPLGLNIHLTNSFFEIPNNYQLVWGRILFSFLFTGILFGVICMGILFFVLPLEPSLSLLMLCLLGSSQIFLFAMPKLSEHLFPYVERPKPLVFTNLCSALCGIILSFVMIYYYRMGYWGLISSTACSSLLCFLIFSYFLYSQYHIKPIIERKWSRIKQMVKDGLPLVPHTLGFMLLSSSARIIMSLYDIDYKDIGLFSHGCQMGTYVVTISTAFVVAISPQIQRFYRNKEYNKYRNLYFLAQGVSLLAAFLICLWMSEIYALLIHNDEISKSSSIATLMCFAQALLPLYTFLSTSCFVDRKTMQLLWLVFVPGITNLILCYFLIPHFGIKVAAYSTMLSYWTQIAMPFIIPYFINKTKTWMVSRIKIIYVFMLMITALVLGNLFVGQPIVIKVLISLFALSISLYIYKRYKLGMLFV